MAAPATPLFHQLTLTSPRSTSDLLERLAFLPNRDKPVIEVRDLFVGAACLGEESLKLEHGWWYRRALPHPIVTRGPCVVSRSNIEDEIRAASQAQFDRIGGGGGWRIHYVALLPTYRVVQRKRVETRDRIGRRRQLPKTPPEQLAMFSCDHFIRRLPDIRKAIAEWTGTEQLRTQAEIEDGLPSMPLRWARPLLALHSLLFGSRA